MNKKSFIFKISISILLIVYLVFWIRWERLANIIKDTNSPFFFQITTLSNHFGVKRKWPTDTYAPQIEDSIAYQVYTRGIYYTDHAVSHFINNILDSDLAQNTIIVLTGDHGLYIHPSDIADPLQKREMYFRVPLCIWAPEEVIKQGTDHTLGSQVDIAPTILDMLKTCQANTFLGNSLINGNIPKQDRYVFMYLGTKAVLRADDIYMLPDSEISMKKIYPKAETMKSYHSNIYPFAQIDGDVLRGKYTIRTPLAIGQAKILSKRVNDLTFLIGYSTYRDTFMGLKN